MVRPYIMPNKRRVMTIQLNMFLSRITILINRHLPRIRRNTTLFRHSNQGDVICLARPLLMRTKKLFTRFEPSQNSKLSMGFHIKRYLQSRIRRRPMVNRRTNVVAIDNRRVNARRSMRHPKLLKNRHLRQSFLFTINPTTNNIISSNVKTSTLVDTRIHIKRTNIMRLRPLHRTITRGARIQGTTILRNETNELNNRTRVRHNRPIIRNLSARTSNQNMTSNIPLTTNRLLLRGNKTLNHVKNKLTIGTLPRSTRDNRGRR